MYRLLIASAFVLASMFAFAETVGASRFGPGPVWQSSSGIVATGSATLS